jgi:hypothetical protein
LALGCTVAELGERMSSRELTEWMVFYGMRPFGEDRDDFRMGQLCSVMAAPHTPKGHQPMSPADFIPEMQKEQTPEEAAMLIKAWAKSNGDG